MAGRKLELKQDKPVVRITSFDVFQPEEVDVRLEFDDHVEVVPMRTISYLDFQRLGDDVPNPVPPITHADRNGPVYDYNDKAYQRALQDAHRLRACKRLLAMLRVDVPGGTEDERVDALLRMDANRLRMLINAVTALAANGEAVVEAKAATFRGV